MPAPIILASGSPFRKSLLERLQLPFDTHSPDIDESLETGESASHYVCRLAQQKAQVVADKFPTAIVIGSDQCALLDDKILGKPGNPANALNQLKAAQGKTVVFHTGLCVMNSDTGFEQTDEVLYSVDFRRLSDEQLQHYLDVEQPYDCAGSFKSEGYGISLFEQMQGSDPSALIGLPLIRLTAMLEQAGVKVV